MRRETFHFQQIHFITACLWQTYIVLLKHPTGGTRIRKNIVEWMVTLSLFDYLLLMVSIKHKHKIVPLSRYLWPLRSITGSNDICRCCPLCHPMCEIFPLHVTLFQTYSLTRVASLWAGLGVCFGKPSCWHWHRLVAGQRSTALTRVRRGEPSSSCSI